MAHSTEDIQTAAQNALKGLEIAQSVNLDKLLNIEQQFKWCHYYMYGMDLKQIGSNPSDPRLLFDKPKVEQCGEIPTSICTTYADFASTYHPQLYFLYLKPIGDSNYSINVLNVNDCESIISNLMDSDRNSHEIDCIIAALNYFGKMDYFMEILKEHSMGDDFMDKINQYDYPNNPEYGRMNDNKILLGKKLEIESSSYFKYLGGFYYKEKSYIPPKLMEEYKEYHKKYEKQLADMMSILDNTPSLQLCWAAANNNDITATDIENSGISVNATAVVNCMSDAVVDGFMNGSSLQEATVKQLQVAIENVERRNKEQIAQMETELLLKQQKSSKMNIIITISISIIIFIFLLILMFFMNKKNKNMPPIPPMMPVMVN